MFSLASSRLPMSFVSFAWFFICVSLWEKFSRIFSVWNRYSSPGKIVNLPPPEVKVFRSYEL